MQLRPYIVVKERSGVRTLTVPLREKPGSLDAEVLKSKAAAARRFLEDTARSAPAFDFEAFREHGRLVEEERAEIERTVLKVGTRTRTRQPPAVVKPPDSCGRRTQCICIRHETTRHM